MIEFYDVFGDSQILFPPKNSRKYNFQIGGHGPSLSVIKWEQ
jgi:hypothetical protein